MGTARGPRSLAQEAPMITSSLLGAVAALVMYAVSVSPTLMARSWWWHASASGVLMAVGYVIGLVVEQVGAWIIDRIGLHVTADRWAVTWGAWIAAGVFLLWFARAVVLSYRDTRQAAALVEMPPESVPAYLLGVVGAVVISYLLLGLLGAVLWVLRRLVGLFAQWMPALVAWIAAGVVVAVLVFVLTSRVLIGGILSYFSRHARTMDRRTARGIYQPQQAERSGSPKSLASWTSVGGQGRVFLGRGPRRHDLEAVTGRPALDPIRAYAGMTSTPDGMETRARLVVDELRRTGAFDRAVIVVATSTGSGWVDEWQVQPVEYLTGGNCATASMQYSYVPSSINFLTDLDTSVDASRTLFTAVRRAIDDLPDGRPRPALYICGESLGAYASQEIFENLDDVVSQVSGALWVGPPSFSTLHRELTRARHRGSPEVAPVVDNGRHVRFANVPENLRSDVYGRELGPWGFPRVVYAQHPSDPVVWWDTAMIWNQPDWLREKAGHDVSPRMEYTRGATFIQVLADLPVAGTAPAGHGHTYHEELIPLWESLLGLHDPIRPVDLPAGHWIDADMRQRVAQAISANIALSDRQ